MPVMVGPWSSLPWLWWWWWAVNVNVVLVISSVIENILYT